MINTNSNHFRLRSSSSLLLAAVVVLCAGCQSFAPGRLGGMSLPGENKRIAKLAQADPFPSPADVGLEQSSTER